MSKIQNIGDAVVERRNAKLTDPLIRFGRRYEPEQHFFGRNVRNEVIFSAFEFFLAKNGTKLLNTAIREEKDES